MAETVFSCSCGMILKVYGDDQAGTEITCPSCQTTVHVPAASQPRIAPYSADETVPVVVHSKVLAILYLLMVTAITLGLVKYLLLPALNPSGELARTTETAQETPDETVPEQPAKAESKKTKKRARKAVEPVKSASSSDLPKYTPVPAPKAPPVEEPRPPVAPLVVSEPTEPKPTEPPPVARTEAREEPVAPRVAPAATSTDNSPYAHIANPGAKKALEFALMNTRHVKATWTAEIFLKSAEKSAEGDPVILNEVKKLREKIVVMRKRAP